MIRQYVDEPDILLKRWPNANPCKRKLLDYVRPIMDNVRKHGDQAVREYTKRFDKIQLDSFKATSEEIQVAYSIVPQKQVEALMEASRRLETIESRRLDQNIFTVEITGTKITCVLKPIQSIGCYVPGGKATYPSSVIMNVVPAKIAGVERVVVCTPPRDDGGVDPLTLVACDVSKVDEVFKIGGVQAIAAMAYGTESVKRVNKIVGPGNKYVTTAKTLVSDIVSIDKPAGPSEILIIADESSDPRLIAFDLISQAEHGVGGISGLVTTSERVAAEVAKLVKELLPTCERSDIVAEVLAEDGFIYKVNTIEKAIEFANSFAPEHLEVMTSMPEEIAEKITNSGLILLGDYTPVSSTDYCMGVNHILPTDGYAKISSGITILDCMKPVSIVNATKSGLASIRAKIAALAEAEGLHNHKEAVEARFR